MKTDMNEISRLRAAVRPLVIDSGLPETPIGLWGTCFMATYQAQLFAITAAHLVRGNHSGEIRVLATDGSMQRLPLSQGIGVWAEQTKDEVDLIVYPASLAGLRRRDVERARMIVLDAASPLTWCDTAEVCQFVVIGYPREHSEVHYELGKATAGQVLVKGSYSGPVSGFHCLHGLQVENPLDLSEFAGFSGSPVFSVEHRLASDSVFRFAGVAVSGSASSKTMHFVDAAALTELVRTAIGHVSKFGLKLAKRI